MALTKSGSAVVSSQSSAAASAQDAVNSGDIDLTGAYEAMLSGKMTNGASAPGAGCVVNCYVSHDGTTYVLFGQITAGITASAVYPFNFVLPDSALHAKIGFGGNTTNGVTVEAYLHKITAI